MNSPVSVYPSDDPDTVKISDLQLSDYHIRQLCNSQPPDSGELYVERPIADFTDYKYHISESIIKGYNQQAIRLLTQAIIDTQYEQIERLK